jgi:class I fructose-bisphosphate aldolase
MRRLEKIFSSDGKTVIIAMDHGMGMHVNPAMDDTGGILKKIIDGGADAVLVPYGIAETYGKILRDLAVILRMDGGGSQLGTDQGKGPRQLYTVEDALRIDADGTACMGFPGSPFEHETWETVANLVREGRKWGMPVMVEALPGGFAPEPPNTVENIRLAVRTSCEYGADIVKTAYVGETGEFRQIIAASYKPVIVLGGEKTKNLESLFACIEQAMKDGASGVAIGRNVWKDQDPEKVTAALVDLVHNGKSIKDIKF